MVNQLRKLGEEARNAAKWIERIDELLAKTGPEEIDTEKVLLYGLIATKYLLDVHKSWMSMDFIKIQDEPQDKTLKEKGDELERLTGKVTHNAGNGDLENLESCLESCLESYNEGDTEYTQRYKMYIEVLTQELCTIKEITNLVEELDNI